VGGPVLVGGLYILWLEVFGGRSCIGGRHIHPLAGDVLWEVLYWWEAYTSFGWRCLVGGSVLVGDVYILWLEVFGERPCIGGRPIHPLAGGWAGGVWWEALYWWETYTSFGWRLGWRCLVRGPVLVGDLYIFWLEVFGGRPCIGGRPIHPLAGGWAGDVWWEVLYWSGAQPTISPALTM